MPDIVSQHRTSKEADEQIAGQRERHPDAIVTRTDIHMYDAYHFQHGQEDVECVYCGIFGSPTSDMVAVPRGEHLKGAVLWRCINRKECEAHTSEVVQGEDHVKV